VTTPPITSVTGGVAGLSATYAAVRRLADRYDAAGERLRGWAATGGRVLVDPDLLESAVLSPVTFAEAEEKVLSATTGLHGVLPASVAYEADALLVRATVAAFLACDRVVAAAFQVLDYELDRAAGLALLASAPDLAAWGVASRPVVDHLPNGARDELTTSVDMVEEWLDRHPEAVQHVADGSGGLLDALLAGAGPMASASFLGLRPLHPTAADAAADLAALYRPEGSPRVRRRDDLWVGLGQIPPANVTDLMDHLGETAALSPPEQPGDQGTIEIQRLEARDGSVRWIVYLPGTDTMTTTPFNQDADVRDMATNLHLIGGGQDTTYQRGIEEAMTRAGIKPHDPVLLAGHSQGGMEAATMLSHGTPFHVTNVVTAGSPIAGVSGYPPGSHILSLENRGDVVPLLDGRDNPDSLQQVTVQFDDHETSIAGNHALVHYLHGAAAVDASEDPSIHEQVASLRAHGYFDGRADVTSTIYQISR
jgi:hypothetical protein